MNQPDLYGGADPRELPLYAQREVARFVGVPLSTLRMWVAPVGRESEAIIRAPEAVGGRLSFNNLVEVYVLNALRTRDRVPMSAVRGAASVAREHLGVRRMLLSRELRWSGDVFWASLAGLVNLSKGGQFAIREMVDGYLNRIEWDEQARLPARLFPLVVGRASETRSVVIDPRVSFGQPTLAGTGVGTSVVARRVDAGEEPGEVARDYGVAVGAVTDALLYENLTAT